MNNTKLPQPTVSPEPAGATKRKREQRNEDRTAAHTTSCSGSSAQPLDALHSIDERAVACTEPAGIALSTAEVSSPGDEQETQLSLPKSRNKRRAFLRRRIVRMDSKQGIYIQNLRQLMPQHL